MRLRLPCSLLDLVPEADRVQGAGSASVPLAARSWTELVEELRGRFPLLAERTLTDAGTPRAGFALVINDEVVRGLGISRRPSSKWPSGRAASCCAGSKPTGRAGLSPRLRAR